MIWRDQVLNLFLVHNNVPWILRVNVTVMAPKVPQTLLLLSPVMHWGVLINTNAWYG